MKLHFESDLDYQKAAIEAVCQLFRGQEINRTEFTVTRRSAGGVQGELGLVENALGIGNRLTLLDDEIMSNLKDIQLRNGLAPSGSLTSGDFTVEMETGTGQDLCLSPDNLRTEQAVRFYQIRDRRTVRCH